MNIQTMADSGKTKALQIVESCAVFKCKHCENLIHPEVTANFFGDFILVAVLEKDDPAFWKLEAPGHEDCIALERKKNEIEEQKIKEKELREQNEQMFKDFIRTIPHENANSAELDNFIVDDSTREAHALACAWDYDDFGLLFSGPSGTGKSHLMIGLAKKIVRNNRDVMFVQTPTLYEEAGKNNFQIPFKYISTEFLFLDDLGTENLNEMKREWIFNLLENRKNRKNFTFISTNLSPKDLREKFFERIASRIFELTVPILVNGTDRRLEKLKERMVEFKARIKK